MREGLQKIVSLDETIVAISTPHGRSAIGLVRVSGSDSQVVVARLLQLKGSLEHRRAVVSTISDPDGTTIDEVVVTYFAAPHSYTGEDLIEISAHGNPRILNRIVDAIRQSGARLATPGEFTLRAVAMGKMDLTQAEAVREFIDAQTEQQARTALRQIEGAVSNRIRPLKVQLVNLIAQMEAGIDFAEDDVDVLHAAVIARWIQPIIDGLEATKSTFGYGRVLTSGACLTIIGKPNVGKSSLFNRLVEMDRAIVTEIPGTTRDVLTETIELDGIPLRVADTAGLRETLDIVESLGVGRSLEALSETDVTLIVLDASRPLEADDERVLEMTNGLPRIVALNKSDLPSRLAGISGIAVSATSGGGIADLKAAIRDFLVDRKPDLSDDFVLTNSRQNDALEKSVTALKAASAAVQSGVPHEMVLLDLYGALGGLNELTGDVVTEDILDRIFSTFCIGK